MGGGDQNRILIIQAIFVMAGLLYIAKLAQLQLFSNAYRDRAEAAAIEKITNYPARGLIYDRNNKLLVNNNPVFDLMVTYNQVDRKMDVKKFCEILDISRADFYRRLDKNWKDKRYSKRKPFVFYSKLEATVYNRLQESLYEFPGFFAQERNVRGYPHKSAAHVLGYIREVNKQEIEKSKKKYVPGDYIGASGLEKYYEDELKGEKGAKYVQKNRMGQIIGSYNDGKNDITPIQGKDLVISIDLVLQQYAEHLMQNKKGSVVAIDPKTGEILTMVSSPAYDPNLLTINKDRGKKYQELLSDKNKPLFNRSTIAKYPPGSIFKPIISLIALQEEVLRASKGYVCHGAYYYNQDRWGCHQHPYPSNVEKAIQYSCNTYFFQTFRSIIDKYGFYQPQKGLADFDNYLYQFGLGKPLGIDFLPEKGGNVPTPEYYDKLYPKKKGGWKSPTILSLGIGQGEIELTTLQMANLAAIIANRGYFYTPHFLKAYKNDTTQIPEKYKQKHVINIERRHFEPVVRGMEKVVTAGTARIAYTPDIEIAGKTGTAQNSKGKDHSIFFAFAPVDNPKIAIAVYVENGGFGSTFAAPIASLVVEKYIDGEISPRRAYLETRMLEADLMPEEESGE